MNMWKKKAGYKILLCFLKSLMYIKRGFGYVFSQIWKGIVVLDKTYRKKIGFPIYKFLFHIKRKLTVVNILRKYSIVDLVGERGLLQVIVLIVLLFMAFPQSRLFARSNLKIPGENTLLYKIVGPGELDSSSFEEVTGGYQSVVSADSTKTGSWKSGSIVVSPINILQGESGAQEIAGTVLGGSALTKPLIIPGADIGSGKTGESGSGSRTEIVYYSVQQGDVIGAIAQRFGISVNSILWANNLSLRSYIRPGDKLAILPTDGVVHKVIKGDTIQRIARLYQANVEEIAKFNNLSNGGSGISIGQQIIIPNGKRIVTSVAAKKTTSIIKTGILNNIIAPIPSISAPAGTGYLWPSAATVITQYYGWRHTGLDIAGKVGVPNYAAKSGTVIKSQCGYNGGYGCYIIIDHGNGIQTLYGHNMRLLVSVGQYVEQGEAIGLLGNTGRSTGPHLHFEIRVNGRKMNPLQYIRR